MNGGRYNKRTVEPDRPCGRPGSQAGYLSAIVLKKRIELFRRDDFDQSTIDRAEIAIRGIALVHRVTSLLRPSSLQLLGRFFCVKLLSLLTFSILPNLVKFVCRQTARGFRENLGRFVGIQLFTNHGKMGIVKERASVKTGPRI